MAGSSVPLHSFGAAMPHRRFGDALGHGGEHTLLTAGASPRRPTGSRPLQPSGAQVAYRIEPLLLEEVDKGELTRRSATATDHTAEGVPACADADADAATADPPAAAAASAAAAAAAAASIVPASPSATDSASPLLRPPMLVPFAGDSSGQRMHVKVRRKVEEAQAVGAHLGRVASDAHQLSGKLVGHVQGWLGMGSAEAAEGPGAELAAASR